MIVAPGSTHSKQGNSHRATTLDEAAGSAPRSGSADSGQGASHTVGGANQTRQPNAPDDADRKNQRADESREKSVSTGGIKRTPGQDRTKQQTGQPDTDEQPDQASDFLAPQGDGNYLATDTGPIPLENQD